MTLIKNLLNKIVFAIVFWSVYISAYLLGILVMLSFYILVVPFAFYEILTEFFNRGKK